MKVTLLQVRNYRALEHADVRPGERNLVIVGGKNRSGKTSLLSALETAFGGAREQPPEPVHHGKRRASIHVELDDGGLVIDRIIDREGRHKLEVHTKAGKQKAPQKMLDQLIGARFLDPLQFLRLTPRAQRDLLVQVADIDVDLDALATDRAHSYDERRGVNRDLKRAQAAAEQLGPDEASIAVVSASELLDELDAKRDQGDVREACLTRISEHEDEQGEIKAQILALQEEIAELERDLIATENERLRKCTELETFPTAERIASEVATLTEQVGALADEASKATAIGERNKHRGQARAHVQQLEQTANELSEVIEGCDQKKTKALEDAKMPIVGLDIDEAQVIYNGAPFEQAADSERLHASLAIAAALSKEVRDVWVRDGSLLDSDGLAAVERFAVESGCRVWIERVGADDSEALVIEEGQLREADDSGPS